MALAVEDGEPKNSVVEILMGILVSLTLLPHIHIP